MRYRQLGRTGIFVSQLCFGLLTMSRLQLGLDERTAAEKGSRHGVNFVDTAVLCDTDDILREFLRGLRREEVVIASSHMTSCDAMEDCDGDSVQSRHNLPRPVSSSRAGEQTYAAGPAALDCLEGLKRRGLVELQGIHSLCRCGSCMRLASLHRYRPSIYNWKGIGILDGTAEDMREAIEYARDMGKGIYCMKALGGGHLAADSARSLRHVMDCEAVDSVAVGIASEQELELNIAICEGQEIDDAAVAELACRKALHVADWCEGCGKCAARCDHGAVSIVDGKATVDHASCVVCGYCASICPSFCLKVLSGRNQVAGPLP